MPTGRAAPAPRPGAHGQQPGPSPYNQPTAPLAYNPYGQQYPGPDRYPDGYAVPTAVRRPGYLYLALLLHVLSALPFLGAAAAVLVSGASIQQVLPPGPLAEFETSTGVSVVSLVVGLGVFLGAVALLFVLFSILAVARRNWARILGTIMTVSFALITAALLVLGVIAGTAATSSGTSVGGTGLVIALLVVAGPPVLALIGTVLMFLPAANRFFARR